MPCLVAQRAGRWGTLGGGLAVATATAATAPAAATASYPTPTTAATTAAAFASSPVVATPTTRGATASAVAGTVSRPVARLIAIVTGTTATTATVITAAWRAATTGAPTKARAATTEAATNARAATTEAATNARAAGVGPLEELAALVLAPSAGEERAALVRALLRDRPLHGCLVAAAGWRRAVATAASIATRRHGSLRGRPVPTEAAATTKATPSSATHVRAVS